MVLDKGLCRGAGKTFDPKDVDFWEHIASNLNELLKEHFVTEQSFSILVQFEQDVNPSVYFI